MDTTPDEMREIMGSNNLNVKSEEIVWETMLKWINQDPDRRKKHVVHLMANIRLGLLETQYFLENVSGDRSL